MLSVGQKCFDFWELLLYVDTNKRVQLDAVYNSQMWNFSNFFNISPFKKDKQSRRTFRSVSVRIFLIRYIPLPLKFSCKYISICRARSIVRREKASSYSVNAIVGRTSRLSVDVLKTNSKQTCTRQRFSVR